MSALQLSSDKDDVFSVTTYSNPCHHYRAFDKDRPAENAASTTAPGKRVRTNKPEAATGHSRRLEFAPLNTLSGKDIYADLDSYAASDKPASAQTAPPPKPRQCVMPVFGFTPSASRLHEACLLPSKPSLADFFHLPRAAPPADHPKSTNATTTLSAHIGSPPSPEASRLGRASSSIARTPTVIQSDEEGTQPGLQADVVDRLLYPLDDALVKKPSYEFANEYAQIRLQNILLYPTEREEQLRIHAAGFSMRVVLRHSDAANFLSIVDHRQNRRIAFNLSETMCSRARGNFGKVPCFVDLHLNPSGFPFELAQSLNPRPPHGHGWIRINLGGVDESDADCTSVLDHLRLRFSMMLGDRFANTHHTLFEQRWQASASSPLPRQSSPFFGNSADGRARSIDGSCAALASPKQAAPSWTTASTPTSRYGTRASTRLALRKSCPRLDNDDDILVSSTRLSSLSTDDSAGEPLFVYPEDESSGVVITTSELRRLEPGLYLNDTLIDLDLRLTFSGLNSERAARAFYFNSFFYRKLSSSIPRTPGAAMSPSEQVYRQVRKWTQHVDIFDRDYLVVPICEHLHWYVAIIVQPWAILLRDKPLTGTCASAGAFVEQELSEGITDPATALSKDEAAIDDLRSSGPEDDELPSSLQVLGSSASSLISRVKGSVSDLLARVAASPADKDASLGRESDDECTIVRSDDASPRCMIMIYDSLGSRQKTAVIRRLKDYLAREAADKLKLAVDIRQCTGFSLRVPPACLSIKFLCIGPAADKLDRLRSFHAARNSSLPPAIRSARLCPPLVCRAVPAILVFPS